MASQLLQYLPAIYTEALPDAPFLDAYLQAFEQMLLGRTEARQPSTEGLEQTIADLGRFVDPGRAPEAFLPWLAGWVALSLHADLSPKQQRELIANMAQLYRMRGTKASLYRLLQIFTTLTPTITEEATRPEFQVRVHSTIGQDTYLSGGRPHRFQVTIDFRTVVCVNEVLPVRIGLRDQQGNPTASAAPVDVRLTSWQAVGTPESILKAHAFIDAGQTAVAFYYKPPAAGNVSVVAESSYDNATLAITVIAPPDAPAAQLAIEGDTVIPVGEDLPLIIARRDVYGNPTTRSAEGSGERGAGHGVASQSHLTVALTFQSTRAASTTLEAMDFAHPITSQPTLGAFTTLEAMDFAHPITSVTIPSGRTSAVILYRADRPGSLLLTATADRLQPATQAITVTERGSDPAVQLAITGGLMAGGLPVARQSAIVRALIDLEKPAHTDYELVLRYPTIQLGVHSTVGLDTLLTPEWKVEPQKERAPDGE